MQLEALVPLRGELASSSLEHGRTDAGRPRPWPVGLTRRADCPAAASAIEDLRLALEHDPAATRTAALRLLNLLTTPAQADPPMRGGLAPWQRRAVEAHMRQRLESQLRLRDLADQASLSVSYFSRAFKESFGTTPRQHVTGLRVELARHLMLTTADPLSQIALACGMADQAHLSKVFRRAMGETPSVWRRRNSTGGKSRARPAAHGADRGQRDQGSAIEAKPGRSARA